MEKACLKTPRQKKQVPGFVQADQDGGEPFQYNNKDFISMALFHFKHAQLR